MSDDLSQIGKVSFRKGYVYTGEDEDAIQPELERIKERLIKERLARQIEDAFARDGARTSVTYFDPAGTGQLVQTNSNFAREWHGPDFEVLADDGQGGFERLTVQEQVANGRKPYVPPADFRWDDWGDAGGGRRPPSADDTDATSSADSSGGGDGSIPRVESDMEARRRAFQRLQEQAQERPATPSPSLARLPQLARPTAGLVRRLEQEPDEDMQPVSRSPAAHRLQR